MSLKVVLFESLGTVSYSPSIVTVAVSVAVCETFSVNEWRDLENQVRGRSRSLKMAPFDKPHATSFHFLLSKLQILWAIAAVVDVMVFLVITILCI